MLAFIFLLPLSEKWELEKRITIPAIFFIGIFSGVVAHAAYLWFNLGFYPILLLEVLIIGSISISLLLWRFYRDPDRFPPETQNVVLSPADGRIIYIKKIEKGEIPLSDKKGKKFSLSDFTQSSLFEGRRYLVGIQLTYLDVHVNRAPTNGRVVASKHINGPFLSLKRKEAAFQNERALIILENEKIRLGIILIASRLVRKIVTFIRQDQEVQIGDRISMIRFGSQVDIILPELPNLCVKATLGEKVKAGISVLARFQDTSE